MDEMEIVKELQKVQLEIAAVIKNICEKHKLRYYLAYGTLIGAVRHNGFIPWDDDIDIMMPYPDLLKFEDACKSDLPEGYFYQSTKTDPEFRLIISRVRKDKTLLIEKEMADKNIHHGIFVDIYPMYGAAPKQKRRTQIIQAMKRSLYLLDEPVKNHGAIMRMGSAFLLKLKTKKGKERAQKKLFDKITRYSYDENDTVVCWSGSMKSFKAFYKQEWFGTGIMHKFEDTEFSIPNNYDAVLRLLFGDYMQLPPEEERKPHHNFVKISFESNEE